MKPLTAQSDDTLPRESESDPLSRNIVGKEEPPLTYELPGDDDDTKANKEAG